MTDIVNNNLKQCSQCKGLRYVEYEHGLIRLPCRNCQGTGSQEVASILKGDEQYAEEHDSGDGPYDTIGVGGDDSFPTGEDSSKPELSKKRKSRKKAK